MLKRANSCVVLAIVGGMLAFQCEVFAQAPISSSTAPSSGSNTAVGQVFQSGPANCTLIDFEGIGDSVPVGVIAGTPNVTFGVSWLGLIDADAGGGGNFANEPTPDTTAFFLTPADPISFDSGVQFVEVFYVAAAVSVPVTLTAWDGPNGTGSVVDTAVGNTIGTDFDGAPCTGDPSGQFCLWDKMQLTAASNNILSVTLSGAAANQFGLDNMTFCTNIPATGACCDGQSCIITTEANCSSVAGVGAYKGDNVPCTASTCATTGACCNAANPSGSPLCTDGVDAANCAAPQQLFLGQTCADVEAQGLCVAVPAVSEWGLVVLTLIGLVSGSIVFGRWRPAKV